MSFRYHTMRIGATLLTATRRPLRFSVSGIGLCLVIAFIVVIVGGRNIREWAKFGYYYPTRSEIDAIEISLTKLLSDTGQAGLRDLFDPDAFNNSCRVYQSMSGGDLIEASTALYTSATYALLRQGRAVMFEPNPYGDALLVPVLSALRPDLIKNLGRSYYVGLSRDPWGNPYQIFAGPWQEELGPVVFRSYHNSELQSGAAGVSISGADSLTILNGGELLDNCGFPAPSMGIYIWSLGANGVSDQPRYDPTHQYAPPARQHYRSDAPDEYLGGGDDVNNWDRNQSYMGFYN